MLHITGLFTGIFALLIIFLAYKVVVFRRTKKVGIGDNGDVIGQCVIRTHANAVEYIPMMILLMAAYELNGGSGMVLYIIGGLSVLARVMHASGLSKSAGVTTGRFYGTVLTWLIIVTLAVLNILKFVMSL